MVGTVGMRQGKRFERVELAAIRREHTLPLRCCDNRRRILLQLTLAQRRKLLG